MKDQITITVRIPNDLSSDLAILAESLQRSRSWVIEQALREYIAREKAFLGAVDEALRADEAGELSSILWLSQSWMPLSPDVGSERNLALCCIQNLAKPVALSGGEFGERRGHGVIE